MNNDMPDQGRRSKTNVTSKEKKLISTHAKSIFDTGENADNTVVKNLKCGLLKT